MRRPAKRSAKRASSCGVRLISGTSTSACRPAASARAGGAQVDLGLAAAGDAVQQHRRGAGGALRRAARARAACSALGAGALVGAAPRPAVASALCSLRSALRELGVVELAQFRRQHRQRQFADAALVVTSCKIDQLAPARRPAAAARPARSTSGLQLAVGAVRRRPPATRCRAPRGGPSGTRTRVPGESGRSLRVVERRRSARCAAAPRPRPAGAPASAMRGVGCQLARQSSSRREGMPLSRMI